MGSRTLLGIKELETLGEQLDRGLDCMSHFILFLYIWLEQKHQRTSPVLSHTFARKHKHAFI